MRVIDCHTHCFPDSIAERAVQRLTSAYEVTASFDGTVAGVLGQMDASGIDISVILPVATKASQVTSINDWSAGIRNDRLIAFGAMHPEFPAIGEEIDRMISMGIRGMKLHPNWQGFDPDSPCAFPIYEAAQGRMIAYFHGGDELEKWPEPIASTPEALANVHRMFPRLTMVVAHMGGYLMWDEVEKHLLGSDVYLDFSACFPEDISDERLTAMIRAHGVERVLYGSDSPCGHPVHQLVRLLSFPFTDEEKELMTWRNASRLLGVE